MTLYTDFSHRTEIQDVAKLFFADVEFAEQAEMRLEETQFGTVFCYTASFRGEKFSNCVDIANVDELQATRLKKRFAKLCLYNLLRNVTGQDMPWGSLTGIRPTKLACQLAAEGQNWQDAFCNVLGVSAEKTQLVANILRVQGNLRQYVAQMADLYVGIPFCVTRCSYCSFTSGEISRMKKYVEPYVDALRKDISATLQFARQRGITLRNVYFGGGTPTSLSAAQLSDILDTIDFSPVEYTVEAGRPDTIDEEKLQVLKNHGVHRVSINPQTFNQSVLDAIGRKHSVQDIYDKFSLAKQFGFDVNMDLIAGLPTETYEMFCHSVDCALQLSPENLTVHTLALKHGSILKEQNFAQQGKTVSEMVKYAHSKIQNCGYEPYYMYRQKYMSENLENVGFCKPGKPCLYNIGIMEEVTDILACGTNAISKKISANENRIERSANAKDVISYIERNEEYLNKKFALFS